LYLIKSTFPPTCSGRNAALNSKETTIKKDDSVRREISVWQYAEIHMSVFDRSAVNIDLVAV